MDNYFSTTNDIVNDARARGLRNVTHLMKIASILSPEELSAVDGVLRTVVIADRGNIPLAWYWLPRHAMFVCDVAGYWRDVAVQAHARSLFPGVQLFVFKPLSVEYADPDALVIDGDRPRLHHSVQ